MKKITTLFIACAISVFSADAAPVSVNVAQKVALNFFNQVAQFNAGTATLAYTETDPSGNALYYVFNINNNNGFVIVSADDALRPIIGYSTEKRAYTIPAAGTNIGYWMQKRKTEIMADIKAQAKATPAIQTEWTSYVNNVPLNKRSVKRAMGSSFPSSSAYLVKSTWDQMAPYYDDCPGTGSNKSVTGCVATAMCQIMRYWQYPSTGQSSSSYYANSYGTLSAKYNHAYPWSSMALTYPGTDSNLSRAMSDAGISVEMSYSPTGSGAYVISADDPGASAQLAYVKYFKYSAKILHGEYEFSNATAWQDTIEHELDRSRPVQYVGSDPSAGGHTWVCDGYDVNNNFHMNWGWSGADNGWYALNNLNPGSFNFSQYTEALIGIMPPAATAKPAAHFTVSSKNACAGTPVQFIDTSSNQPTSWSWTFTGGSPSSSALQNPAVSYTTPGTYPVKLVVKNSFGQDSVTATSYITVSAVPVPVITFSGDTLTCTPSNLASYVWTKSGVTIPGATSYRLVITTNGVYVVTVASSAGCTAYKRYVVSTLGINEISLNDNINAYPNPTTGNLKLVLNVPSDGEYTVAITDMLGQVVYSAKVNVSGEYTQNINLSGCSKGVYFLSVNGKNARGEKKIMVY